MITSLYVASKRRKAEGRNAKARPPANCLDAQPTDVSEIPNVQVACSCADYPQVILASLAVSWHS